METAEERKNQDLYDNDEYEVEGQEQNYQNDMAIKVRKVQEDLADSLMKKRNEAVEYRVASGIEREWRKAETLFEAYGEDKKQSMLDYATGESRRQSVKGPKRSTVVVNIIRGRCEQAEGRFSDIQLPVDDKNWSFKETPVPSMMESLEDRRPAAQGGVPLQKQDGSAMTISDVAEKDKDKIKKKMKLYLW